MKGFEQFNLVNDSDTFKITHILEEEKENPYSKEPMGVVTEKRYPLTTLEEVKHFYEQEIAPIVKTPKGCPVVDFEKLNELLNSDLTLSIFICPRSIAFRSFLDLSVSEELCSLLHVTITEEWVGLEDHHVNEKTIRLSEVFKYPE